MTRVLIAERQTLIRKLLRMFLDNNPSYAVVADVTLGSEVIEKLQQDAIDALILNVSMPDIAGVDLISRAKVICPKLTILAFSTSSDTQLITHALKNGADGYISTMHDLDEFSCALHKVIGGGRYIDPAIAENMLLDSILGSPTEMHAHLSSRELEIFRLLVRGKNLNEIAYQLTISNKTVSSHKKRLMEKMHFSSMADLMRYGVQRRLFDEHDMPPLQNASGGHFANISAKNGIPSDDLTYQLLN